MAGVKPKRGWVPKVGARYVDSTGYVGEIVGEDERQYYVKVYHPDNPKSVKKPKKQMFPRRNFDRWVREGQIKQYVEDGIAEAIRRLKKYGY